MFHAYRTNISNMFVQVKNPFTSTQNLKTTNEWWNFFVTSRDRIFHLSPTQINYIVLILIIFRNQITRMNDSPFATNEAYGNWKETIMILLMNNKICMQIRGKDMFVEDIFVNGTRVGEFIVMMWCLCYYTNMLRC